MKKISVLVVDDSAVIRSLFKQMLNAQPDIEVVDTAEDPYEAREKIKRLNPQVVTLDIEMPKMDGLSFLEKIMSLRPMPVIMVSSLTQKGAQETMRALEIGAIDCVSKPVSGGLDNSLENIATELAEKVRAAAQANLSVMAATALHSKKDEKKISFSPSSSMDTFIIAIGSSTGGVEALREIFKTLPNNLPPIVIAQHMPAQFTASFAARLNTLTDITVCEAQHGQILKHGHAYVAPGGRHLKIVRIDKTLKVQLTDEATVSGHRPSVDVLFSSVAKAVGSQSLGIILTGMGRDGANGLLEMKNLGAHTIGQNEASCVVYGMPRCAAEAGAVNVQCSLEKIPAKIVEYLAAKK